MPKVSQENVVSARLDPRCIPPLFSRAYPGAIKGGVGPPPRHPRMCNDEQKEMLGTNQRNGTQLVEMHMLLLKVSGSIPGALGLLLEIFDMMVDPTVAVRSLLHRLDVCE